jgi:hypothetical protein
MVRDSIDQVRITVGTEQGAFDLGVARESTTGRPQPGQLLFYPASVSETEILIPYGVTRFSSVAGELTGNRFLTIVEGLDRLAELGKISCGLGAATSSLRIRRLERMAVIFFGFWDVPWPS